MPSGGRAAPPIPAATKPKIASTPCGEIETPRASIEEGEGTAATYCVNFQVGDAVSPSTIVAAETWR